MAEPEREASGKAAEESLDEWTTPRPTLAGAGDNTSPQAGHFTLVKSIR